MDIDFDDLISSDAAINAKANKKFQPVAKPKPKPKPKPKTLPEPKSIPTPLKQVVQTTATATNEPISRIEEKQIENDVNIHDHLQSSDNKSQKENAESVLASESVKELLHESRMETENSSLDSETPNVDVSMDENLETGPVERDFINDIDSCTNLESHVQIDPLTGEEATICNDNLKDPESSSMWESLDIMDGSKTRSGAKLGKFKPKPNAQTRKVVPISDTPDQHTVENINFTEDESIPLFQPNEFHVKDSSNPSAVSQVNFKNQAGRSSERLKKKSNKAFELVDEPDDDITNDANVHENEETNCGPEIETFSEKEGKKSKKPVAEKVKKVRKRKKASEDPGGSNDVAKKRFRHSTKRNKRPVNPELLKIPEEEREMHIGNFPIGDIIRFSIHREQIAKKVASTSTMDPSSSGISNDNDIDEGHDNTYYNYGSYTKRTPRMKWSKQDTELFFEAIQQFGSDLSMITECFPGRTRAQIKSKYKKEERQQPLRLTDALTTRAKGHTHFEEVIERLKQAQGEDSENDDPSSVIGEDDDEGLPSHETKEDADTGKPVQSEKEFKDDIPAAESPTKSNDSEDDMFRWSQYKSEL